MADDPIRKCGICGRWLSESNKSPDRCFHHQTPEGKAGVKILKAREAHEEIVRSGMPVCTSRSPGGFVRATIDYHGSPNGEF